MHSYRLIGLVLSVVLTVALSLGLASAAGYIPGGDELPFLAPVQEIIVTHGLAKDQPDTARAGKANNSDVEENAAKSPGSGRPEELGPPPGQARDKSGKGAGVSGNAGDGYHATGRTADGQVRSRYQIRCDGLHIVVNTSDPEKARADYCPDATVKDAAASLTAEASVADNGELTTYVNRLQTDLQTGNVVEQYNFYGPLSKLNQLRPPGSEEAAESQEADEPEDDDANGNGDRGNQGNKPPKKSEAAAQSTLTGAVESMNGSQWVVAGKTVIVPGNVKVPAGVAVGTTVKIEGVAEGDHLKATKVDLP